MDTGPVEQTPFNYLTVGCRDIELYIARLDKQSGVLVKKFDSYPSVVGTSTLIEFARETPITRTTAAVLMWKAVSSATAFLSTMLGTETSELEHTITVSISNTKLIEIIPTSVNDHEYVAVIRYFDPDNGEAMMEISGENAPRGSWADVVSSTIPIPFMWSLQLSTEDIRQFREELGQLETRLVVQHPALGATDMTGIQRDIQRFGYLLSKVHEVAKAQKENGTSQS